MVEDYTNLNKISQEKNTLLEIIQKALAERHWNPTDLSKQSEVSQPVIWRFLRGGKQIGVENIYRILKALDLIKLTVHQETIVKEPEAPYNQKLIDHFLNTIERLEKENAALREKLKPYDGNERRKALGI